MKFLTQLFRRHPASPELIRAQLASFAKKIPLLYFILTVDCVTVAYSHFGKVPPLLGIVLPVLFVSFALGRLVVWARAPERDMSDQDIVRLLGRLYSVGLGIGVFVVCWAMALMAYGDTESRGHVAVVVGITVFAATFLLMHARAAAALLTAIVVLPFSAYLLASGDGTYAAIAVNLLLVTGAMMAILYSVSRDFERMVDAQVETKRLSDENARLAKTDMLTSLPNRRQFFQRLEDRIVSQPAARFAVGVIDLDGFKAVNDLYGHVVGDEVLVQVGERLTGVCGDRAFVARLAGDEFAILAEEHNGPSEILSLGERICAALEAPYATLGAVANISSSLGLATYPDAAAQPLTLYERADFALYHAKQNRRGRPVMFSSEHETELRKQGTIEQALRKADLENELTLVFQPLLDVHRNRPIAFEALARWTSPELGVVSPLTFIPVAERSDLISRITQILLRKALAVAATWPDDIQLTFNLSVRDLISSEAILQILSIVNASGVRPSRLDFEVTETALLMDFDQAQESIRLLKALGARISLDDFGTGYSSLSYVYRLPLDKIKIDRSFVTEIETKDACRDIVRTVVGLCRDLGINCVVEGMENQRQAQILRDLGCEAMQGYFFSRPLHERDIAAYLALTDHVGVRLAG